MAARSVVLAGYRSLLTAINVKFRGDAFALEKCRAAAAAAFRENAGERDPAAVAAAIAEIKDATDFLMQHIQQAQLNEAGRYELKLTAPDSAGPTEEIAVSGIEDAAAGASKKASGGCCGGGCH